MKNHEFLLILGKWVRIVCVLFLLLLNRASKTSRGNVQFIIHHLFLKSFIFWAHTSQPESLLLGRSWVYSFFFHWTLSVVISRLASVSQFSVSVFMRNYDVICHCIDGNMPNCYRSLCSLYLFAYFSSYYIWNLINKNLNQWFADIFRIANEMLRFNWRKLIFSNLNKLSKSKSLETLERVVLGCCEEHQRQSASINLILIKSLPIAWVHSSYIVYHRVLMVIFRSYFVRSQCVHWFQFGAAKQHSCVFRSCFDKKKMKIIGQFFRMILLFHTHR